MGSDAPREAKPKGKAVAGAFPPESQLNAAWEGAPSFFGKEMVMLWGAREETNAFEGPLVKNGHIPPVNLFSLDHTPAPNEKVERVYTDPKVGPGNLTLQWDGRGKPSQLSFKDKAGNVEDVTLDAVDPTRVRSDVYRQTDGTVARIDFDSHGDLAHGSLTKGKNQDRFDFDSGFHAHSDIDGGHFILSDDHTSRFIESTFTPTKGRHRANAVVALRYNYENNGGDQDGELNSVVLTFANGSRFKAFPDDQGKWVRQKLTVPNSPRLE
jgi:hypothetical protein